MNLYVASSWRNTYQPRIVELLRKAGHEVYAFRNPRTGKWRVYCRVAHRTADVVGRLQEEAAK